MLHLPGILGLTNLTRSTGECAPVVMCGICATVTLASIEGCPLSYSHQKKDLKFLSRRALRETVFEVGNASHSTAGSGEGVSHQLTEIAGAFVNICSCMPEHGNINARQLRSRLCDIERLGKGDYSAGRLGETILQGEKTQQLTSNSDEEYVAARIWCR